MNRGLRALETSRKLKPLGLIGQLAAPFVIVPRLESLFDYCVTREWVKVSGRRPNAEGGSKVNKVRACFKSLKLTNR